MENRKAPVIRYLAEMARQLQYLAQLTLDGNKPVGRNCASFYDPGGCALKKFLIFASAAAALACVATANATEFVTNGNFATLSNGLGEIDSNTVAAGWSSAGYNFVMNVADVGSNGTFGSLTLWDAANGGSNTWDGKSLTGDNFVAMDGAFQTAPVEQTITGLTVGQSYKLSFDYAFAQQHGFNGDTLQHISASFGGTPVFTSSPDYPLPDHGFSGWSTQTLNVTATSSSEVLSFLAYGNLPVPPFALLTDVSLSVPEPATWAMMIVGLGAMGVAARRRRRALTIAETLG